MILPVARDEHAAIGAVADAVGGMDMLVTTGGASVGDHDLVIAALKARGMTLDFWQIAMRPGKPLLFGQLGATPVLGLPGNPVSAMVCAILFLLPALSRLSGLPAAPPPVSTAVLGAAAEAERPQGGPFARDGVGGCGGARGGDAVPGAGFGDAAPACPRRRADPARTARSGTVRRAPKSGLFASICWACDGDGLRKSAYTLGYSNLSTVSLDDGNGTNIEQL